MNQRLLTAVLTFAASASLLAANTTARLALPVETARTGDTILVGVVLEMDAGWHTYWKNPGEAGMATEIQWSLPDGVTAGDILWPTPERYVAEGLTTFVYHDSAVLLIPLSIAAEVPAGSIEIEAEVSWLECKVLCIPGGASLTAELTVGNQALPSSDAELIEEARLNLPQDGSGLGAKAGWEDAPEGNTRSLIVEWPVEGKVAQADFLPYPSDDYEMGYETERLPVDASRVAILKGVELTGEAWPSEIAGLIVFETDDASQAFTVQLSLDDPDASGTGASVPAAISGTDSAGTGRGILVNMLLALGGGLILNLMPCVLPILSLKVLSLVRQGGSSAAVRRKHGIIYTLGVLVSFWAIAGLVMAGSLVSWGAQFQDPRFVVAVTVLMTLVALNLFGVFEFILPGSTVTGAAKLASHEGAGGAFFNGVLAVVLGASCVAPLLAAAIGWALSQPPILIFLTFTMIGLGLALPFLLLSFFPGLQSVLPKPGAWMEKFKIIMGFPMLATAAWLLSQTVHHFGVSGPLWVGLFLVMLSLALWIYGDFVQRGSKRRGLATVIALLVALGGYTWAMESQLDWRNLPDYTSAANSTGSPARPKGLKWEPWSIAAVEEARANKRLVLVDFTASWCLTCESTVKPALEKENVIARLTSMNAVTLLADFTLRDPEILAGLKEFQRAGVPLVVIYPASPNSLPQVLPDPLPFQSPSSYAKEVLVALDQAANR